MDVEKTIEFILQHQATSEANFQRMEVNINRLIEAQYNTEQNVAALAGALGDTDRRLDTVSERLDRITARVDDISVKQARTDEQLSELTQNVNLLFKVVDGLVRRPPQ